LGGGKNETLGIKRKALCGKPYQKNPVQVALLVALAAMGEADTQ
jgi:hypothetical protein